MESNLFLACILCCMSIVSAYDIFEGFLKQGKPCFDVAKVPAECHVTLAENFQPTVAKEGNNEPTTLVYLFTPNNPDEAEQLHECGGRLQTNSNYDPEADTEIFIHGWLDGVCRTAWMREMKEQLLQRGKYNIMLIDWTWGNTLDLFLASSNCRIVGQQVGFIISNIMQQTGAGPEKFHVIGHSFGAIAGGYVGRYVIRAVGNKIRRITGLDPALPPLRDAPPEERLTYRDAQIVDVIHTNAFNCSVLGAGDERHMGHADFYPNGGKFQTSCNTYILHALLKGDLLYAIGSLEPRLCSHLQALQFYKLSINSKRCQYVGVASKNLKCFKHETSAIDDSDWAVMGMDYELYHRNDRKRQKYYLKTTNSCPYYDDSYLGGKKFPFSTSCTS